MPIKNLREEINKTHRPIIVSEDNDRKTNEFTCKWCHRIIRGKFTEDSVWCNSCQSETIFDKDTKPVRKSLKAEVIDDTETLAAFVPTNASDMVRHTKYDKPKELKGGALALSKKGTIRFTSYYDSSEGKENAD
jgi:hypothetical protein